MILSDKDSFLSRIRNLLVLTLSGYNVGLMINSSSIKSYSVIISSVLCGFTGRSSFWIDEFDLLVLNSNLLTRYELMDIYGS